MTNIGALPLSAGLGVFHGVTGVFKQKAQDEISPVSPSNPSPHTAPGLGVLHGVTGVFKHKEPEESIPISSSDQSLHPLVSDVPVSAQNGQTPAGEPGTLRVSVMDAKGLVPHDIKPYTTVRVGDKESKTKHTARTDTPAWNESFSFAVSSLTPKVFVCVHDHKTLGKDKEVAEGEVDIWHHIKPNDISSAEIQVQLRPAGTLHMRLEFNAGVNPSSVSVHSGEQHLKPQALATSPSRFSIRGRRPGPTEDEAQA